MQKGDTALNNLIITSTGSNKGKTLITSLLLYSFKKSGIDVHAFKCGPDYIDPMYHSKVLGIPSKNLDTFFCDDNLLRAAFYNDASDTNIIEGCMGLYDGIGLTSNASTYSVAKALSVPILLIVDCKGMGIKSIEAIIRGYLSMDEAKLIKAVFLNRISDSYYEKAASYISERLSIAVAGHFKNHSDILLSSRHLGLKNPAENNIDSILDKYYEEFNGCIDLNVLLSIANIKEYGKDIESLPSYVNYSRGLNGKKIGVALDEAFNFYYEDNLSYIKYAGAEIVFFSPVHDDSIPDGLDGLYFGGGYPENYAAALSQNKGMLASVYDFAQKGGHIFAECGGFMYLHDSIDNHKMVGIFNGNAYRTKGLVRFGYVDVAIDSCIFKGHEFHHYDIEDAGNEFKIVKASDNSRYTAGKRYKNVTALFPHIYFFSKKSIE